MRIYSEKFIHVFKQLEFSLQSMNLRINFEKVNDYALFGEIEGLFIEKN